MIIATERKLAIIVFIVIYILTLDLLNISRIWLNFTAIYTYICDMHIKIFHYDGKKFLRQDK